MQIIKMHLKRTHFFSQPVKSCTLQSCDVPFSEFISFVFID